MSHVLGLPMESTLLGRVWRKPGIVIYSVKAKHYRRPQTSEWGPIRLPDSQRLLFTHNGVVSLLDSRSGCGSREGPCGSARCLSGFFSITRDGRDLYFLRFRWEADIWMLTLNEERE